MKRTNNSGRRATMAQAKDLITNEEIQQLLDDKTELQNTALQVTDEEFM